MFEQTYARPLAHLGFRAMESAAGVTAEAAAWIPFVGTDQAGWLPATVTAMTGFLAQAEKPELSLFQQILNNPMFLVVGMFIILYLTMLAPERRRKADEAKKMSAIGKNDRVVTIGGIHGVVVSASPESDVITLRVDESGNTRIKINRSAIATVADVKESKDSAAAGKNKD